MEAVARAGIAAGADGLIIEVHNNPDEALSDGGQSLRPERFATLVQQAKAIAEAIGRSLALKDTVTAELSVPSEIRSS